MNKIEIVDDYDSTFYQTENTTVKESFENIGELIADYKNKIKREIKIADIGCAIGTFPNYLKSKFNDDFICGYEISKTLVSIGRNKYPELNLNIGSIIDRNIIPENKYDVITCLGVISIFDDYETVISNLCYWIKEGGKLLFHGMFNPYDIDVLIKYKRSSKIKYQSGWNIVSQQSMSKALKKYGAKKICFNKFKLSIDLVSNFDPTRSWTFEDKEGTKHITNGLCIDQPQYILEVSM